MGGGHFEGLGMVWVRVVLEWIEDRFFNSIVWVDGGFIKVDLYIEDMRDGKGDESDLN